MKNLQFVCATALALMGTAASADEVIELNMATPFSGGHWYDVGIKGYAETVEKITSGRVKINVFPAGALGPALKVSETVKLGIAEAGYGWGGYDWSIDRTGALFGSWPGGPNPEEYMMWMINGNGGDLLAEWRMEKFDVVSVPCGVTETEIFMHAHKPVRTVEDLEGLKLRTSSAWAEIAPKLGVSTVVLPGSEVFSALERKVVDAVEWGGPGGNVQEGLDSIAPYVMLPGVHSRGAMMDCLFNKDAWAKIPESDQELLKLAGQWMLQTTYLAYTDLDLKAYETLKSEGKAEIIIVEDSLIEAVAAASAEWADEQSSENEWFSRVYDDQKAFLASLSGLTEFRFAPGDH